MKNALILVGLLLLIAWGRPVPPPAPLAADVDRVVQARFARVTDDDIREGRLGVSRMLEPARHPLFAGHSAEERRPLERLREEGWELSIYIQSLEEGEEGLVGPIRTSQEASGLQPAGGDLSKLARCAIVGRKPVQAFLGGLRVEARPIPASSPRCVRCHRSAAQPGSPLGAALYVLQKI